MPFEIARDGIVNPQVDAGIYEKTGKGLLEGRQKAAWRVVQIFDGDYGCEELPPDAKPKVSVTLENESGEQVYRSVEDDWLLANGLDVGSTWPPEK